MDLKNIDINAFTLAVHQAWEKDWFLLTSGDFGAQHFNTMTVAWGSLGVMWSKPFAMVAVRPQRYTHEFTEKYPDFTLCAFPAKYKKVLSMLGSTSGRDGDKIAKSGLNPCAATVVGSPAFAEACLVIECRIMYRDAFDPKGFVDPSIATTYAAKDYHSIYFGEVVAVRGTAEYGRK